MNKTILVVFILVVFMGGAFFLMTSFIPETPSDTSIMPEGSDSTSTDESMESTSTPVSIDPISHASAVLEWDGTVIYLDPVGGAQAYEDNAAPDVVFITHTHGDHLNIETLTGVVESDTTLVVPETVMNQLPDQFSGQVEVMENGDLASVGGLNVRAIPMYNLPESPDTYHVKGDGNGYVLEQSGYRVYVAGDTSGIPEMRRLTDIDMAFVPMNLPYTMDVDEASDAVLDFAPDKVYPYHYRNQDDTLSDVERFKSLVEEGGDNIEVMLLDWYPDRG